jgi:hypothetical protein
MVDLRDLIRGPKYRKRKKQDGSDSHTDYQPPTTEKLKKFIVESLTSRTNDAAKIHLVQFISINNKHIKKRGWIRPCIPTSSLLNNALSEEGRKTLVYFRIVFKARSIQLSELEHAFDVSGPTILSIANAYFGFFDSNPPSTPHVLHNERDSPTHTSYQSTPLAQATKRARTGTTSPFRLFDDKKGEEGIEIELENEDSTKSVTGTPSPRDPDDDNDFAFQELFTPSPPERNVAVGETPTAANPRRNGLLNRIIQSAKKSATRNVSSEFDLLEGARFIVLFCQLLREDRNGWKSVGGGLREQTLPIGYHQSDDEAHCEYRNSSSKASPAAANLFDSQRRQEIECGGKQSCSNGKARTLPESRRCYERKRVHRNSGGRG